MHIYLIGQQPHVRRIEALAAEALQSGHSVTIAYAGQRGDMEALGLRQAQLLRIPSFDPTIPGGRLFSLFAVYASLFIKTNTIHVHDWSTALFVSLLSPFMRNTAKILTISDMPRYSYLARVIIGAFDRVFSSSRTAQYKLLALHGIKTGYIPDGYHAPALQHIRPAVFGLRKDGYAVILAQNASEARKIVRACKIVKITKKLVIFAPTPSVAGCTRINVPPASRSAISLIRQAGFVIATDSSYTPLLLQAMDAKRHIIATTDPLHEETLGTTASYFDPSDSAQLASALKTVKKHKNAPHAASIRAKNHFSWEKSGQEYLRAYRHNKTVFVPFDSIIPRNRLYRAI